MVNICKGQTPGKIFPKRFEQDVEKELYSAFQTIGKRAEKKISQKDYPSAMKELSLLRKPIDDFFNGVLVMVEDDKIKANRLSLLGKIAHLFFKIGDFSKITTIDKS